MSVSVRSSSVYFSGPVALTSFELALPFCHIGDFLLVALVLGTGVAVAPPGWPWLWVGVPPLVEGGAADPYALWSRVADAEDAAGGKTYTWTAEVATSANGGVVAISGAGQYPVLNMGEWGLDLLSSGLVTAPGVDAATWNSLTLLVVRNSQYLEVTPSGVQVLEFSADNRVLGVAAPVLACLSEEVFAKGATGERVAHLPAGVAGVTSAAQLLVISGPLLAPALVGVGDGWEDGDGFRVLLSRRDFACPVRAGAGVHVQALRFGWDSAGGPSWAALRVVGPSPATWEAAEWLGCPVEIYSPIGELVWWGFVNSLYAGTSGVTLGVGLDGMANRVAARYSQALPGSPGSYHSLLTDWVEEADSLGEFGIKERVLTGFGHDRALAVGARDAELVRAGPAAGGVWLYCRGWLDTLSWRYYAQPAGLVEWAAPNLILDFGHTVDIATGWAQSFGYAGDSWTATTVEVRLARVRAPADSVRVSLRVDAAGVPGAEIAGVTVAAAELGVEPRWLVLDLGAGAEVSTGTYWVTVTRPGAADAVNYFRTWGDRDRGFAGGGASYCLLRGDWLIYMPADLTPPVNMCFRVRGVQEHTEQISVMVAKVGQFLAGCEILSPSGVSSSQYRAGTSDALHEVKGLLATGAGGRLLGRVRSDRILELRPAPLDTDGAEYWLNADGIVVDRWGWALPPGVCLAGVWVGLGDVIPGNADVSHYGRVSPFWVEGSVYEVGGRRLRLLGAVGLSKDDVAQQTALAAGEVAL